MSEFVRANGAGCSLRMVAATQDSVSISSSWVQFNKVSWGGGWVRRYLGAEEVRISLSQKKWKRIPSAQHLRVCAELLSHV